MGHGKHVSSRSDPIPAPTPPVPVADYNVTGTLTPKCSCNYFYSGILNNKPYYYRENNTWFLWYRIDHRYVITSKLGEKNGPYWFNPVFDLVAGNYTPTAGATGTAVVSAGPH